MHILETGQSLVLFEVMDNWHEQILIWNYLLYIFAFVRAVASDGRVVIMIYSQKTMKCIATAICWWIEWKLATEEKQTQCDDKHTPARRTPIWKHMKKLLACANIEKIFSQYSVNIHIFFWAVVCKKSETFSYGYMAVASAFVDSLHRLNEYSYVFVFTDTIIAFTQQHIGI